MIIVLILVILLSLLGVLYHPLEHVGHVLLHSISEVLSFFGKIIGNIINKIANWYGYTGKTFFDITEGTLHDVGNLVKDTTRERMTNLGFAMYNNDATNYPLSMVPPTEPSPDFTLNPIQSHLSSNQSKWCSVGTLFGQPSCVELGEYDRCLSEKVFPTQKMCLNPTLTNNM
jgi:hypothetical protein